MYEYKFDEDYYEDDYDMYEIIYSDIKILVEDEFDKEWTPLGRRPYYQMRGKRISEEQAFDIISGTDLTLHIDLDIECMAGQNFYNNWFGYGCSNLKSGWVHPNGIVGINSIMQKYPNIEEFAEEWAIYLYNFPFLDLIVGITHWNEVSDELWKEALENNNWDRADYFVYDDFCDNLEAGIWVHDNRIEIINEEKTIEIYKQYEELYEEEDRRVYFPRYYYDFQPDITTRKYLERCLARYGITDCEKLLREKLGSRRFEELKKTLL